MEVTWQTIKAAVKEALEEEMAAGRIEITSRYKNGTMLLQPPDKSLKPKEMPIENFWKKITSVREKLRVLEQKINNNKNISAEERAELQMHITRCYGSLTSFNVLFKFEDDRFEGMKSE